MGNLSIKKTAEREDRLRRLMAATGESTMAGAIDVASKHYLADLEAKRRIIDELDQETIEVLSTPYIPLEVEISTSVGRRD